MAKQIDLTEASDTELILRFQEKANIQIFEILYDRYAHKVFGRAKMYLKDVHDAEDVAQNVMVKIYFGLSQYNSSGSLLGWIYTIVRNESINFLKKKNIIRYHEVLDYQIDEFTTDIYLKEADLETFYTRFFPKLSSGDRTLLFMAYGEGFSMEEISNQIGISITNVKVKLHRIKKRLTNTLNENFL